MEIRPEKPEDISSIAAVTKAAFAQHPHSIHNEHQIIDALREAGALTLSLVALNDEGGVVGHVAFSPVSVSGADDWYGLGPIAVAPAQQGNGIGTALIKEGLMQLKQSGAQGCVVMGEPDYYTRFGFERHDGISLEGAPPEYFIAQKFGKAWPAGIVVYHHAFYI